MHRPAVLCLMLTACAAQAHAPTEADTGATLQTQQQPYWCWAAAAKTVGDAVTGEDIPQCKLVSDTKHTDCCTNPHSPQCNAPGGTGETPLLANYGIETQAFRPGDNTEAYIREDISLGRPAILGYAYPTGGGHSTTVTAYKDNLYLRLDPASHHAEWLTYQELQHYGTGTLFLVRVILPLHD